jgi:hypothetical protein
VQDLFSETGLAGRNPGSNESKLVIITAEIAESAEKTSTFLSDLSVLCGISK